MQGPYDGMFLFVIFLEDFRDLFFFLLLFLFVEESLSTDSEELDPLLDKRSSEDQLMENCSCGKESQESLVFRSFHVKLLLDSMGSLVVSVEFATEPSCEKSPKSLELTADLISIGLFDDTRDSLNSIDFPTVDSDL